MMCEYLKDHDNPRSSLSKHADFYDDEINDDYWMQEKFRMHLDHHKIK
jgi:hypothetical protein